MPISGSWLQRVRRPYPQYGEVHTADPQHMEYGQGEQTTPPPFAAPAYQEVAPQGEPGAWAQVQTPGLVLDRTPEDHNFPREYQVGRLPSPTHLQDTSEAQEYQAPQLVQSDERYYLVREQGFGANASRVPELVLRRNLDGQPENSPPSASYSGEGFRRAYYYRFSLDRNFKPPRRVHTYRITSPQLAATSQNATVPDPAGPYNSPFDSLSRAIRTWHDKPQLRRVPQPVDEDQITDGLDQGYQTPVFEAF